MDGPEVLIEISFVHAWPFLTCSLSLRGFKSGMAIC